MVRLRIILLLGVFAFCAALGLESLREYNQKATIEGAIRDTGFMTVRALRPGTAKLFGRIASPDRFEAPLSGGPCALHEVKIEKRGAGLSARRWTTVSREISGDAMLVFEDGTGETLISTGGMSMVFSRSRVFEPKSDEVVPERLKALLDSKDLAPSSVRVTEGCYRHGDSLYVLGTTSIRPGTARQLLVAAEGGYGVIGDMPERRVLDALGAENRRSAAVAVLAFGMAVVILGSTLLRLHRK